MSLDFDGWLYDGQQWDNVPKIVPTMFQSCEKNIKDISLWIKRYKLDEKFNKVEKQNEENKIKVIEVESYFDSRTKQMQQQNEKEMLQINNRLEQQEETIRRLEKKLKMRQFTIEEDLESKDEYMQLNRVYSEYFKLNNKSQLSSINSDTQLPIQQRKQSNPQPKSKDNNKTVTNNPKNTLSVSTQNQIITNNQRIQNEEEEIEVENEQYDNQYIIWKMINTAINKCYLNREMNRLNETMQNRESKLISEIDKTKGKIDSSNNLISQVDLTIKEVQKMNENKFDKIFSLNLDNFSNKLERGLQDIEILQQSKILIETLDSKYDEKCNILHSEIKYTHKRIDEVRPPIDELLSEISSKLEQTNKEHETTKTSLISKFSENVKTINEKIMSNYDSLNVKIDSFQKESKQQMEQQNNTIKSNSTTLTKNVTSFRSDIIADLEKLENGIGDIFVRIKEFQSMVIEIQKQLLDIAEMEHIQFNHNLQQKMTVFITNVWNKADKTQVAIEKLIDSILQHQQQLTTLPPDTLYTQQSQKLLSQLQQQYHNHSLLSPKAVDSANSQTFTLDNNLTQAKRDQNQFKHFSMDEVDELNNEDMISNHCPIIHLKSMSNNNARVNTSESQQQESPHLKQKPFIKEQMKLKKIQYTNACKEHNISFNKALNLETSMQGNRISHSSQKAKRPLTLQGSAATTTTAKASGLFIQQSDKITRNPSHDYQSQIAMMQNKKLENYNPSKSITNKFYDNKEVQGFSENQDLLFNQSTRLNHSQNRKRAVSQNRTKALNNSIVVFNTSTNPLVDSHTFDNPSGNTTNGNNIPFQLTFASPFLEPALEQTNSPLINQFTKHHFTKKQQFDQNLQKNLLDIKFKILKKVSLPNNDQQQHFADDHFNTNQQQQSQK